jgi:hypothetical protein
MSFGDRPLAGKHYSDLLVMQGFPPPPRNDDSAEFPVGNPDIGVLKVVQ